MKYSPNNLLNRSELAFRLKALGTVVRLCCTFSNVLKESSKIQNHSDESVFVTYRNRWCFVSF